MNLKESGESAETSSKEAGRRTGGFIDELFGSYKREFVELLRREVTSALALHKEKLVAEMAAETERVIAAVREVEAGQYRNVQLAAQRLALLQSAEFARTHLDKAATFTHPHGTLRHALELAPAGGMALEFGVFSGTTLGIIAEHRQGQQVYGFDSFQGLPEDWRSNFPAGAFAISEVPVVAGAELVVGWFDATLPGFLASHPGPVDFLHIDCDLYSSTKTVLDLIGPRLRPGSIVMFDEYFNYPGWDQHEAKAWNEFLAASGLKVSHVAYTVNNEQVVARIDAV